jgi:hypothetical protein
MTAAAAISLSLTTERNEEKLLIEEFRTRGIRAVAVDFGGDFNSSVSKIIERAVVSAQRENVIDGSHAEEGAVAGAAHEAITQLTQKAFGLNVGGKIGIARYEDHISVSIFFAIGLLNLNDVTIGFGHRAV